MTNMTDAWLTSKTKVKEATVDFGSPIGTYTYREYGRYISGKPFPSEGEAYVFGEAIKVLEWFMNLSPREHDEFLKSIK